MYEYISKKFITKKQFINHWNLVPVFFPQKRHDYHMAIKWLLWDKSKFINNAPSRKDLHAQLCVRMTCGKSHQIWLAFALTNYF